MAKVLELLAAMAISMAVFVLASFVCMVVFGLGEWRTSLISLPLAWAAPILVLDLR